MRRHHETLVQSAKMAVAAVLSWLIAKQLHEPQSFIAPYAAVFMMGGTILRSMREAVLTVTTMIVGVVVAFVVAVTIPSTPAALGVAVFAGMLIGSWRRLGQGGIWVGVVALLMITYGTADNVGYLVYRVAEGLLGSVIGLAVNVLVLPPLRLKDGDRAVARAATKLGELFGATADGLRRGWSEQDARDWHREATEVERTVRAAEDLAREGRESTWLNPRALRRRGAEGADAALATLYDVAEQARHIAKTLVESDGSSHTAPRTEPVFDREFAGLLTDVATGVDAYRDPARERRDDREVLLDARCRARDRRAELAREKTRSDHVPPRDWSAHAALLLAAERALKALLDASTPDC